MKAKWSYRGKGLGPRDAAACVIDTRHHEDIGRLTEMILEKCLSKRDLAHMLAYGTMQGSEERRLRDAMAKAEEFMVEHRDRGILGICRHPSNLGGATEYDDIPKGCPLKEVRTWGWR